ncbi:MAG: M14 family metallopeptidase, partial [Acidobacteria bacterium]|nr:M14 family metallopeptidase [Acidobacteriota bacterium]
LRETCPMTALSRVFSCTRPLLAAVILVLGVGHAAAQPAPQAAPRPAAQKAWPLTRPEATTFAETSRYDDVMSFMKAMAAASPQIRLTTYGYTYEGRPMPLAVIGATGTTPQEILATKKTRVYIQGNIHAGEVEGKEALLWLLRSIAKGERADWFKTVVLLINPVYNADGNERVSVANRGSQNGPVGGMGQRANAQNLDLNRDCTKLETAEARSLAMLLTKYDPQVAIDLHTTDGSTDSGFYLTYETSLNPNDSTATTGLLRDTLLPLVTKNVKAKHGWDFFYYGGVMRGGEERAWSSDADLAKPRYTSTYFGVRNKLGILVETYSYASFEDRIKASYWFLEETLDYIAKNGDTVRRAVAAAESESVIGKSLAVRQKLVKGPEPKTIVFAQTVTERNPYVPDRPMRVRVPGGETTETMAHYGTTEPTETSIAPRAWVLPNLPAPPQGGRAGAPPGTGGQFGQGGGRGGMGGSPVARVIASVVDRLEAHGIKYTRTEKDLPFKGDRFKLESSVLAQNEYQGTHKMRTVTGAWEATEQTMPAGSIVVPMDQPLARLAFILFDPRSDDGFMAWNILDAMLGATPAPDYYPVWRTMEAAGK